MPESDSLTTRTPPQNIEAEQALLGAILSNNQALEKVSEFLRPEHFSNPLHGRIYAACVGLIEQGRIADPITLKDFFARDSEFNAVENGQYLDRLTLATGTIINAHEYGQQIFDRFVRRQLVAFGTDVVNDAHDISLDTTVMQQVENAEKKLYQIADTGMQDTGPEALSEGLKKSLKRIETAMQSPSKISGVPTGLSLLDNLMGGLHESELIIIAARPGMGKTALATCLAHNIAQKFMDDMKEGAEPKTVAFFSLEMSAEELATRILSSKSRVSGHAMRLGDLTDEQFDEVAAATNLLNTLPLYVDETPSLTVNAIVNRARRLKRDKNRGLGLIIIDYLQLISSNGKSENRVQELSAMTRALKIMAKELNVPVIVLSQLSRMVEQRDNKRPQLSDLRESGSIEQDADIVMFIYREIYYLEHEVPQQHQNETAEKYKLRLAEWEQKKQDLKNIVELIISKQRHGPVGNIKLFFDGALSRFDNLESPEVITSTP